MKGKLFSMMSREEQMEWAKDFSQWFSVDFPKIQHVKVQTLSMCVTVEHGLNLLSAFPYCRSFVSESLTVRDYHRRLTTILKYATKVSAEVRNLLNTEVDLNSPKLLTPHRDRKSVV